jgi:propionyl-CoA carboxylase beta chain
MVKDQSFMFITGAKVTQAMTGEVVDIADLGGPHLHAMKTGACHMVVDNEGEGIAWLRRMLGYLTPIEDAPQPADPQPELESIIPTDPRRSYDMLKVVRRVLDEGSLTELSAMYGRSLLTVLGRLGGRTVAIVASQPRHRAGCLDIEASRKGAHFVRWASRRGLAIITLVDVPGYLPGLAQEAGGILSFGAELLEAYGSAVTPKISVVVRKSYGGANVLSYQADYRIALLTAEVAPMGAEAAVQVAFPPMPTDGSAEELAEARTVRAKFRDDWRALYGDVWTSAKAGYFDRVVRVADLRAELDRALVHLQAGRLAAVHRSPSSG